MKSMMKRLCRACGKTAWHNPCAKDEYPDGRCTYCGYPVPTGNKRDGLMVVHQAQVNKARTA